MSQQTENPPMPGGRKEGRRRGGALTASAATVCCFLRLIRRQNAPGGAPAVHGRGASSAPIAPESVAQGRLGRRARAGSSARCERWSPQPAWGSSAQSAAEASLGRRRHPPAAGVDRATHCVLEGGVCRNNADGRRKRRGAARGRPGHRVGGVDGRLFRLHGQDSCSFLQRLLRVCRGIRPLREGRRRRAPAAFEQPERIVRSEEEGSSGAAVRHPRAARMQREEAPQGRVPGAGGSNRRRRCGRRPLNDDSLAFFPMYSAAPSTSVFTASAGAECKTSST